jgi:hypothetical protein
MEGDGLLVPSRRVYGGWVRMVWCQLSVVRLGFFLKTHIGWWRQVRMVEVGWMEGLFLVPHVEGCRWWVSFGFGAKSKVVKGWLLGKEMLGLAPC